MMELNQKIIDKLNSIIKTVPSDITDFKKSYKELKSKIDNSEQQWSDIVNNMSGWTKFFAGALGGNRSKVREANELVDHIDKLKEEIKTIAVKIEKKTKSLDSLIIKELRAHFEHFDKIYAEKEAHSKFNKTSTKYVQLVKKAYKGVQDALIFMSWNKLIKHPDAKSKLDEFITTTRTYQKQFESYLSEIESSLSPVVLEKLIVFDSEAVAMSNFQKIIRHVNEHKSHSGKELKLVGDKIDNLLKDVKKQLGLDQR